MRLLQTLASCVLLWISHAQSQAPVMSPAVQVNLGQRATLNCAVGIKENRVVSFYKQIPGQTPKLILYHHDSYTTPIYGPGISSAHYTATVNSAGTEYKLIITDTEIGDTAHYYCEKWYNSINGSVFSERSKLVVTGARFPEPSVVLFSPQPEVPAANVLPTLTCHISNLSVGFGTVNWKVDGSVIQSAVTSEPSRDPGDNTFSMSSYLTLPEVNRDKVYTCQIQQAGSDVVTSRSLKLSECL